MLKVVTPGAECGRPLPPALLLEREHEGSRWTGSFGAHSKSRQLVCEKSDINKGCIKFYEVFISF